ncbi:MAG: ribosomal protein S18-alanine N-acetyltransferase [Eubacteriales bacterium]|nr:ribosomal protein S18-alanine N-acetyltransferase [Eubacteriales bacterium]
MDNITIRRMTSSDIEAVQKIDGIVNKAPWSLESYTFEITQNPVARYFVAEFNNDLIGFCGMQVIIDEGHITNIAVLEEHRGKGIGSSLFYNMLSYASNLGAVYMTLEVRKSNAPAIALYKKFGFFTVSTRKNYYPDTGEDAYIMVLYKLPEASPDFTEPETLFED